MILPGLIKIDWEHDPSQVIPDPLFRYFSSAKNIDDVFSTIGVNSTDIDSLIATWSRVRKSSNEFSDFDFEMVLREAQDIQELTFLASIGDSRPDLVYFYLTTRWAILSEVQSDLESAKWYQKCFDDAIVVFGKDIRDIVSSECTHSFNSNRSEWIELKLRKIIEYLWKACWSDQEAFTFYCLKEIQKAIEMTVLFMNTDSKLVSEKDYHQIIYNLEDVPEGFNEQYNTLTSSKISLGGRIKLTIEIIRWMIEFLKSRADTPEFLENKHWLDYIENLLSTLDKKAIESNKWII